MKDFTALLSLPASLLSAVLIPAIDAQAPEWPYNLPRSVKYHPEHEAHVKRNAEVQSRLAQQAPVGVKKMSDDHGQKFFLDYWGFEELDEQLHGEGRSTKPSANDSLIDALHRPIVPHSNHNRLPRNLFGRSLFARDFDCPANTNSCDSIGYSDVCCPDGSDCVHTSAGVGCCPDGQECGDSISDCDSSQGYTQCDTDSNSGCCVPGAQCESGGCVFFGTQTVYTTLPTDRVTSGVTTTIETSSGREITVLYTTVQSSLYTTTETVTATPEGYTTTRTIIVGGIGGDGGDDDTTDAAGPPVLPTTNTSPRVSAATITSFPYTTTFAATDACPTGFYMCSARYLGGCCRVDRNCDTTSCPPLDTTTITSGADATVAGAATTGGGSCAQGWALCPEGEGGGCCPSGFQCGQQSCSATASGQEDTQKMTPNRAGRVEGVIVGWVLVGVGLVAGGGMVWL